MITEEVIVDRRSLLVRLMGTFLLALGRPAFAGDPSTFHAVYDDPATRDRFFWFLQNVFHLYPEAEFHQAIIDLCSAHADDRTIYEQLQLKLDGIAPFASSLTYAVPALTKQKEEMASQARALLSGRTAIDGYVEIGTTGRYVGPLTGVLPLSGPVTVVNDVAPGFGPVDLLERGRIRRMGQFVPLGDYDPIDPVLVPDASVDVVSSFIGFHHCPVGRLEGFLGSVHRVLRPGGHLIVREHDVVDAAMDTFVALAHDVFNAGVALSWEENSAQVRGFRSVAAWTGILEAQGFRRQEGAVLQDHDPTDNTLVAFVRA